MLLARDCPRTRRPSSSSPALPAKPAGTLGVQGMVKRIRNIAAAGLLALFIGAGAAPPAGAASVYWGANIGDHLTGASAPYDMNAADQFESMTGKRMSLMEFSLPWAYCNTDPCSFIPFPTTQMESIRQRGSIPVFGWASYSQPKSIDQPDFRLAKIADGTYDAFLRQWADSARDWGHPFFLQFDWEMNLNGVWPYSESVNGNRPGDFVKAWRHVHDIFRAEGATNATWVWCANIEYPGSLGLAGLYPGDAYVDWSCIDGYNWNYKWTPFSDMLGPTYDAVQAIAPSKPLLIGEMASTEKGGSKADWIKDALNVQIPRHFPNVKGFVWFEKWEDQDWPIETSTASKDAFAAAIASPFYAGANFTDVASPIPPLTPVVTRSAGDGDSTNTSGGKTPGGKTPSTTAARRCVARRSKVSGRRVLVCAKQSVIQAVATKPRIRSGFSLPVAVAAANAAIRVTLNRDTKVVLRFERRSGKRYAFVPGSVNLRLLRGAQGILFAGRLNSKRTLDPGRYRLSVTAVSAAGVRSQTVRSTFRLLP